MVLSGMNPQVYDKIWPRDTDEGVTWLTPESEDEIAELQRLLDSPLRGSEGEGSGE